MASSCRRAGRGKKQSAPMHPNRRDTGGRAKPAQQYLVPPSLACPKRVLICCHSCGYDPSEVPQEGRCPKCGSYSWERYAAPVRLLPKNLR